MELGHLGQPDQVYVAVAGCPSQLLGFDLWHPRESGEVVAGLGGGEVDDGVGGGEEFVLAVIWAVEVVS